MTVDQALDILQAAVDRCRVDDIDSLPVVHEALNCLEDQTLAKRPIGNFRSALQDPHKTPIEREALWQALYAALNAIRLSIRQHQGPS